MARFLLLTHIFPPAVDGGSKIIAKIGEYLTKNGHQILVITSDCTSTDDFVSTRRSRLKGDEDGHRIIRLPVITFFHRQFKLLGRIFPVFKTLSKGPIFCPSPFLSSLKAILQFRPDFIIAGPLPTTIIIYASLINHLSTHLFHYSTKLLFIPCFHPNDSDFQNPFLISILKKCDYLWCLTNFEKKYLKNQLKINLPQYFVKGLGVDPTFIIPQNKIRYPNNPRLLFIANFSAHKRTELLIKAFELVLKKYPQAKLTLLGQKTLYFPQITKFLKTISPSTQKNITFIFNPTQVQIKKFIDQATCLILPSIHESFGLVFVEGLARGKAIIGANTPQTKEVIKTLRGGYTFKTDDIFDLRRIIIKTIKSPLIGLQGYQTVKNSYTWDKIGKYLCQKLSL